MITQFFGAFNDNAWKMMIITLALAVIAGSGLTDAEVDAEKQKQAMIGMVIFSFAMMIFSLPAGALCDRTSKRSVIIATKVMELVLMVTAAVLLWFHPLGTKGPFILLALMGVQSAMFGPAKYGILPELLPHDKLSHGNGLLQMWTMMAIIAGTALGPIFLGIGGSSADLSGWITAIGPALLIILSTMGLIASFAVPRVPAARSKGGMIQTLRMGWSAIRADRMIALTIVGTTIYWTTLSVLGQNVIVYTTKIAETVTLPLLNKDMLMGIPFAMFGLGLGIGAACAGKLSAGKIEHGLVPLGAGMFGLLTLLVGALQPGFYGTITILVFMGVCAGFVIVPLGATLQWRSPEDRRGAILAISAVISTAGTIGGSYGAYAMAMRNFDTGAIFMATGALVLLATLWSLYLMPLAAIRMIFVILAHTIYRFKVIDRHHVPEKGGALLVCNHVSLIDAVFLAVVLDRSVRMIMHESYAGRWWMKPIGRALKLIPINLGGGPRELIEGLKPAGEALDRGSLVCVFPEGQATRTGMLNPFRTETERIVKGRDVPLIPVSLAGVWGSIFSFQEGRWITKMPQRLPYPVTVAFGKPLEPGTPFATVRQAVMDLGERAWNERKKSRPPLHRTFIRRARRHPFRVATIDETRGTLSGFKALAGAIALARALKVKWGESPYVGILLPSGSAAAMVNIAASLAGRASVNLNFTAGRAALSSAARQADLKTVVTSRAFLEKAKIEPPEGVEPIILEDLTVGGRATAFLLALLAPARMIERACGARRPIRLDDPATVIFTSGSTGEPKGVVLSHWNIDSNVEGAMQIFPLSHQDRILGILPLFHSFGTLTLWLAINNGIGIVFHPNPLDAVNIGRLVQEHGVTLLIATPTFLQLYLRRCDPAQFASLRMVLTGAEKLSERLAAAFEQRFGIRPIEGYGATECSPIISSSTLDVRYAGVYQAGSKPGTVGRPLPGVTVRIVDPESLQPLDGDQPGMLLVKGPNVMKGYLGRDDLTQQVIRDGWYVTGDMAQIDADGFIRITGRLSRFSKIGGEMVPHGTVEEALQEAAGAQLQVFAVTAVPDERKGERLAVLHTIDEAEIPGVVEKLSAAGLPNLFIPSANQFIKVDALPLLGTGKLDLRAIRTIAAERLGH